MSREEEVKRLMLEKPNFDELKSYVLLHLGNVLNHYSYNQLSGFYLKVLSAEAYYNQLNLFPGPEPEKESVT